MTFKRNITDSVQSSFRQRVTSGPGMLYVAVLLLLLFLQTGWYGNCCSNDLLFGAATTPKGEVQLCCSSVELQGHTPSHHANDANAHKECMGGCDEGQSCGLCDCLLDETPGPDFQGISASKRTIVSVPAVTGATATKIAPKNYIQNKAVLVYRVVCPSVPAYLMNRVLLN